MFCFNALKATGSHWINQSTIDPMASATILVHCGSTAEKGKSSKPKRNQHQLEMLNRIQYLPGDTISHGGQRGRTRQLQSSWTGNNESILPLRQSRTCYAAIQRD